MKNLLKGISFILITLFIVPLWFITATLNFIVYSMLFLVRKDKFFTNTKSIIKFKDNVIDYKQHLMEVFYFY